MQEIESDEEEQVKLANKTPPQELEMSELTLHSKVHKVNNHTSKEDTSGSSLDTIMEDSEIAI